MTTDAFQNEQASLQTQALHAIAKDIRTIRLGVTTLAVIAILSAVILLLALTGGLH